MQFQIKILSAVEVNKGHYLIIHSHFRIIKAQKMCIFQKYISLCAIFSVWLVGNTKVFLSHTFTLAVHTVNHVPFNPKPRPCLYISKRPRLSRVCAYVRKRHICKCVF